MNQHDALFVWQPQVEAWEAKDNWQQLRDDYGVQPVCLYFPTRHLLQVSTELSAAQLKQLGEPGKQYLFEDTTLSSVEQLQVRQMTTANTQYLYALPHQDINQWQQSAQLAGFSLMALLPDFLLLPIPEEGFGQQLMLYHNSHTSIARLSEAQGLAVSYLPLLLERLPQLNEVCLLPEALSKNAIKENGAGAHTAVKELIESAQTEVLVSEVTQLPTIVSQPERHALNYFVKTSAHKLSPYLKTTVAVAALALVMQFVADGLQWYQYAQAADATKAAVAQQYVSWFPDEPLNERTSVRTQLSPKLVSGGALESDAVALMARIAPVIKQADLTATEVTTQADRLLLTLVAENRNALDEVTQTLSEQGLNARLGTVENVSDAQVGGQVTVLLTDADPDSAVQTGS